mmetsp:Transcript_100432/g.287434  ORF Transcript_100432/g.287434 Transcript_100432/m.287434 type:complete len:110 (-) Transcript_100432:296-625(-)
MASHGPGKGPTLNVRQNAVTKTPRSGSVAERFGAVVISGYLHKKGKLLSGWQRRYFVAQHHFVKYYQDDTAGRPLLAAIDLDSVMVVRGNEAMGDVPGVFRLLCWTVQW